MGKEEAFFSSAVSSAVAEDISAKNRKETVPWAPASARVIPTAWAHRWDLAFCPLPLAVTPHHAPGAMGRGGGDRGARPSPPPAAATGQLCRQMCPLPVALQLGASLRGTAGFLVPRAVTGCPPGVRAGPPAPTARPPAALPQSIQFRIVESFMSEKTLQIIESQPLTQHCQIAESTG